MAEQIKAGTYELVAERWDELVSKPTEPARYKRHLRGDQVRLTQEEAERLVTAGAVVEPGALQRAAVEQARQQYLAALQALPDGLRDEFLAEQTVAEVAEQLAEDDSAAEQLSGPTGQNPTSSDPATAVTSLSQEPSGGDRAVASTLTRPPKTAPEQAWIDFAVAQGADFEDAKKLGKKALIERYGDGS